MRIHFYYSDRFTTTAKMEEELKELRERNTSLLNELTHIKFQYEEANTRRAIGEQKELELLKKISALQNELQMLKEDYGHAQDENGRLKKMKQRMEEELESLNQRVTERRKRSSIALKEAAIANVQAITDQIWSEAEEEIKNASVAYLKQIEDLKNQLELSWKQTAILEEVVKQKELEIQQLNGEISKLSSSKEQLKQSCELLAVKMKELEMKIERETEDEGSIGESANIPGVLFESDQLKSSGRQARIELLRAKKEFHNELNNHIRKRNELESQVKKLKQQLNGKLRKFLFVQFENFIVEVQQAF